MIQGKGSSGTNPQQEAPASAKPVRLEDQPTVITSHEEVVPVSSPEIGVEILAPKVGPGSVLGPYEILEYIGGGGMGRVFRAFDARLSRVVALKVLTPEQASDPQTLARFQNEARSAARLNHPGIVQVYAAGEQNGVYYIAFEFIEGVNLRRLVEDKGPLPWVDAVRYVLQVAEALDYANRRGVVHRDIKPSNILVTNDGQAKLIDLGLARVFHADGRSQDLTSSGTTLGTFDYIAPEQARDPRLADVRSDIYSLGCTLYFLLTGQPPFPGGTVLQKLLQHQTEEPPDVRTVRRDVPEALVRILRRMMAKSPRQRFPSAADLVVALREVLGIGDRVVRRANGKPAKNGREERWRRHLPWVVPAAVLFLATVLFDWWWSHGAEDSQFVGDEAAAPVDLFSPPAPAFRPNTFGGPQPSSSPPATGPVQPESGSPSGRTQPAESPSQAPPPTPAGGSSGDSARPANSVDQSSGGMAISGLVGSSPESPVIPSGVLPTPNALEVDRPGMPSVTGVPVDVLGRRPSSSGEAQRDLFPTVEGASSGEAGATGLLPFSSSRSGDGRALLGQGFQSVATWVRWVDPTGRREGSYSNLEAACRAALPGDEIRLDFDGALAVRAVDLRGRSLRIVGEKGRFPELVCRFDERSRGGNEPFFLLAASDVSFENVAFRFEVSAAGAADSLAAFRLARDARVKFAGCVLTFVVSGAGSPWTPPRPMATFFECADDAQTEVLVRALAADSKRSGQNIVEVERSMIRGEADVIRSLGVQGGQLKLSESLVAASGRLLDVWGSERAPSAGASWEVFLKRVTALCCSGLIRQRLLSYQLHLLPIRVESEWCIFAARREASLILQEGPALERALRLFSWVGRNNFYEIVTRFWAIVPSEPGATPYHVAFDSWMSYWGSDSEQNPAWGAIPWKNPLPLEKVCSLHQPSDYQLAEPEVDDVAAELAGKAGCPIELLPRPLLTLRQP